VFKPLKRRVVFLVTSNIHKFEEVRRVLSEFSTATAVLKKVAAVEIQDDHIENIAKASARDAAKKCRLPIIVEDAGLFIQSLESFPGPYSSYVYRTIGNDGILKLMEEVLNRNACFKSAVAFFCPSMEEPLCFTGEVKGKIVEESRGKQGFGFDPIFAPFSSTKTFAEMTLKEKNNYSHRALSIGKFAQWFAASF
jgi:XTP/dITP diphosphohydrolase